MNNYDVLSSLRTSATSLKDELKLEKIPDEIDILRYACRKYFISFCVAVGMPDGTPFVPTRFHTLLADKLQRAYERVKNGEDVRMIVEVPPQHGKLLAHSTPILTTKGWVTHGELKPGDFVFGRNGKPVMVEAVSQDDVADYDVEFTDGTIIKAHANHEWVVNDRGQHKERTLETKEILNIGLSLEGTPGKRGNRYRFQIDANVEVDFDNGSFDIHPYVLGAWLGDGKSSGSTICASSSDMETIDKCAEYFEISNYWQQKETMVNYFYFKNLVQYLRKLDLINNKHIPEEYLLSSRQQRLELLAGLIDTDGYVYHTNGRVTFSNINKRLIDDVKKLVVSLGWRVSISQFNPIISTSGIQGKSIVYQLCFQPTESIPTVIPRKKIINKTPLSRRRAIKSIIKSDSPEIGRCIQVDGGIYLAGETLIPTHNSSMVSELFPAWVMGQESWPVICASYGASLAEVKSKHTRDIVSSDVYKFIFPDAGLSSDSTAKNLWVNRKKAMYKAVGRGAGLTGTPGKIMIADDLIADKAEANSETIRESAWDWWNTVFYTRKQQGSFICLVETRWHLDDPAGKLEEQQRKNEESGLKSGSYDHWERLTFPAIAEEDEYIDGKLFRKVGEALAPERFTLETLEKTKNAYIAAGLIGDWAALYQQNPIISENAKFRRQWFRYYEEKDLVGKKLYYTTTVDLAISQKKEADNTVVRTVAKEVDGPNWYLMEETAGRMDPLQTIDAIFRHHELYRSKVYIESVAYQAALQYFVVEEMRKRQQYFQIEEIKPTKAAKKEERIEGLIPLYRAGIIHHRKGQDEDLEMELMQFPKGRRDDRIDALSYHLQVVRHAPRQVEETQNGRLNWKKKKAVDNFDPNKPFSLV